MMLLVLLEQGVDLRQELSPDIEPAQQTSLVSGPNIEPLSPWEPDIESDFESVEGQHFAPGKFGLLLPDLKTSRGVMEQ